MQLKNKYILLLNKDPAFLAGILLFILTAAVFLPAIHHDFLNYDDQLYITENTMVLKGITPEGVYWAFTNIDAGSYYPLTWLSHMIDSHLYGLNPGGHHFSSILLHSINTFLLFVLLRKMTGDSMPSFLTAAIFAFHPLHVEPVAWVSSRKDVLSTFFWILTMFSYVRYVKQGGIKKYLLTLLCFLLGLMSKPILIALPLILLITDYWPLYRLEAGKSKNKTFQEHPYKPTIKPADSTILKLVYEKIPFCIISFIFFLLTFTAQKRYGAVASLGALPISDRISNVLVSYAGYIFNSINPVRLSVFYPLYLPLPYWKIAASFFLLLIISYGVIKFYRTRPYLMIGWLWFLGTLVPVVGFIQIGSQAMADRYMYIPLVGVSIIFSWSVFDIMKQYKIIRLFPTAICFFMILLIIITSSQLRYWHNRTTLFEHAVKLDDNNLLAHKNLAFALATNGREIDAIQHYYKALGLQKSKHEVHYNLGKIFQSLNRNDKAIYHYKEALAIDPDYLNAALNLGTLYFTLKKYDEATHYLLEALRVDERHTGAHNNLGAVMAQQNNIEGALYHLNMALKIDPYNKTAIKNLNKIKKGTGIKNMPVPLK